MFNAYYVFDTMPEGSSENVMFLGGWSTYCPVKDGIIQKYNIDNPYRLIADESAYVIVYSEYADNIILISEYINTYYNANVKATVSKDYGDFRIYQFVNV